MKLTKKLEAEILKEYHAYWNAYLSGNIRGMSVWMDDGIQMIGSGKGEVFRNKKETLKYYKTTADQVADKVEMRNRAISLAVAGTQVHVTEECDFFALIDAQWTFYSECRISTAFTKSGAKWKIIHQHGSIPDIRTDGGEQLNTNQIKAENIQLRDAVKRRTIELEQKNHELEIEASLERVRAKTMAMHSSEDVGKCVVKMFGELTALGVDEGTRFGIGILNHENENNQLWTAKKVGQEVKMHIGNLDMTSHPLLKSARKAWKAQVPFHKYVLKGKDLLDYYRMLNTAPDYKIRIAIERLPKREIQHCFIFEHGFFYAFSPREFQPDLIQTTQRFSSLFAQTYRRYLDLVKAEGQAHEAEIELALERVRASSMAMQKSEELKEVIKIVYQQLNHLKINLDHAGFVVDYTPKGDWHFWIADELDIPSKITHPWFESVWANQFNEAKEKAADFFATHLNFEEKNKFYSELLSYVPGTPEASKDFYLSCPGLAASTVLFDNVSLYIENFSGTPYSDEENKILIRFGKVFQQTYTRFLDLQKAEAQAREAKIEASLERIRSKAQAMRISEDLLDVVSVVREQMSLLGQPELESSLIYLYPLGVDYMEAWYEFHPTVGSPDRTVRDKAIIPIESSAWSKETYQKYLSNEKEYTLLYIGPKLAEWYKVLQKVSPLTIDYDQNREIIIPEKLYYHFSKFSGGALLLISNTEPLDDSKDLQRRAASAFELAFSRYNDLKLAEAQAREAQIEVALERVRSRSLAMHHSDELREIIGMVYILLSELKVKHDTIAIQVFDFDTKSSVFWPRNTLQKEAPKVVFPYDERMMKEDTCHRYLWEAMDTGKSIINKVYTKQQKDRWFEYIFAHNDYTVIEEHSRQFLFQLETLTVCFLPERYSGLYAESWDGTKYSEEDIDVLKRAARVFEQAYVRFLDLQKAEAQAREAQIEAALEKVRSRAMAMHQSHELAAVLEKIYQELQLLGFNALAADLMILTEDKTTYDMWVSGKAGTEGPYRMNAKKLRVHPNHIRTMRAWKRGEEVHEVESSGKTLKSFYEAVFSDSDFIKKFPHLFPKKVRKSVLSLELMIHTSAFTKLAGIRVASEEKRTETQIDIQKRFARVFEQTYTRFLDLQKAEAQAREAQIETALERVRSRSLAMHKSEELEQVILVVSEQLQQLQFKFDNVSFGFDTEQMGLNFWLASPQLSKPFLIKVPYIDNPSFNRPIQARKNGADFNTDILSREENLQFLQHMFDYSDLSHIPAESKSFLLGTPGFARSQSLMKNTILTVGNYVPAPYSQEHNAIIKRFGNVFEQAYVRFLDLQKAEAQAREAQIEVAVERVRAQSMAMHHPDDLNKVNKEIFKQLNLLQIEGFTGVSIFLIEKDGLTKLWDLSSPGNMGNPNSYSLSWDSSQYEILGEPWRIVKETGEDYFILEYPLERIKKAIKEWEKVSPSVTNAVKEGIAKGKLSHQWNAFGKHANGLLSIDLMVSPNADTKAIVKKITAAFNLAYQRFLDLQKAEAQTREAQIEAALERVRSRSMGMQKSIELKEIIKIVYQQLTHLKINIDHAGFVVDYTPKGDWHFWIADEQDIPAKITHPWFESVWAAQFNEAKEKGAYIFATHLNFEEKNKFYHELLSYVPDLPQASKDFYLNCPGLAASTVLFDNVSLYIENFSGIPYSDEENKILVRFGKVFEQTYTRFLDLQKAEIMAQESRIEAALEKVRGKAIAMHNSNDLLATAGDVFTELRKLGIKPIRCGVGLLAKDSRAASLYRSISSEKGDEFLYAGTVALEGHPTIAEIYDSANRGEPSFPVLKGELLKTYYEKVLGGAKIPNLSSDYVEYGYFLSFTEGFFYGWSGLPIHDQELKILNRFKTIIDLTFRRYIELQNAEANALEAIRSASLDRVRAETASMRTTGDLEKITPLIWNELITFEVPFIRCGVYIVDEVHEQIHTFLSTPDGKAIGAFHLPLNATHALSQLVLHWRKKEMYKDHWDEAAFIDWTRSLVQHGAIAASEKYITENRPTNLYLHFLPFLQGMLYVGNNDPLSDEQLHLVQTLADAFSTAYARYEDFNKLESAKQQIEKTLIDLKLTQSQLIQSEKMASLGELTAGIAHEIQNPLNFVNNFSEVSNELIKEIQDIRHKTQDQSNKSEEDEILNDIASNLEKINHHGKRAADIVKGMLQHSRNSGGAKEPTDINTLCDEYLRLSYHGLRAKDKSFNAKFEMDFDASLPKINVVPQDVGRVVLNLINNAFYAVNEKSKLQAASYEPQVSIGTRKLADKIEITVKDNGNGIPEKIKEKIFQPFFTTKPTGQGTGLGLSLSYDIVKAHGGELKVETKDGEGSTFIILLPLS